MMEGLTTRREQQAKALNAELAIHGLAFYGLLVVLTQLGLPDTAILTGALLFGGAVMARWLERRWAVDDIATSK